MPTINLDTPTYERLTLVAATLGVSESDAVAELLRRLTQTSPKETTSDGVRIHAVYKKVRIEAEFDPATEAVTVLSEPWAGKTYKSPSRAAIEVVRHLNPDVHPNRNGWGFWLLDSNGKILDSIRRK